MHPTADALALLALGEAGDFGDRDHLDGCPPCRDRVTELTEAVSIARHSADLQVRRPPDRVWQRVLAEVRLDRPPSTG